jgi:hypothetical protein
LPNNDPDNETEEPESELELSRLETIGLLVTAVFLTVLMGGLAYVATGLQ